MRAKFQTFKSNKDGSMTLYFEKGLEKHRLLDLEGCMVTLESAEFESNEKEEYPQVAVIMAQIDNLIQQIKGEK